VHRPEWGSLPDQLTDFPMNRDFQIRFIAGFLVLLTVAAITLAWINFRKENQFILPYDGVWWVERDGNIVAAKVDSRGPGAQAGIKIGDRLIAIDTRPATAIGTLVSQLYHDGIWSKPIYTLQRGQYTFDASPILAPADRAPYNWLRVIAVIYLAIGLYVLFRRWTAPGSTHFYIFCVVSFALYAFHYTGKLNSFDWTIYWGNVTAWLLQPALHSPFPRNTAG
jgi:two-component system, NtrC family, sensor kinase